MIAGILLAAGRATRFGSPKLLAALPDGTPVVVVAARRLRAVVPDVVAVVRPDAAVLRELLVGEGCEVVVCPESDEGMSASLRCGLRHRADAEGWLVALADMPAIQPASIAAVYGALPGGARLAAPYYRNQQGHPVGFHRDLLPELLALRGDTGARALLERHAAQLQRIAVNDPGVLADIDTPADLERLSTS